MTDIYKAAQQALEHRSHLLKAADDQIAMLTTQRDELLEALKKTAEHIEAMRAHIKPLRFKQHCWQQALNARAIIAAYERKNGIGEQP